MHIFKNPNFDFVRWKWHAIAVSWENGKIGYLAPEVALQYYETIRTSAAPVTCPAQRGSVSDHETSGVEFLLDLTAVPTSRTE